MSAEPALRASYGGCHRIRCSDYDVLMAGMAHDVAVEISRRRLEASDVARLTGRSDNGSLRELLGDIRARRGAAIGFDQIFRLARGLGMQSAGGVPIRQPRRAH